MTFCSHCGKEVVSDAVVCPHCGCAIDNCKVDDTPSIGLNIVAALLPVVGLILFIVYHSKAPTKAKSIGIAALLGFFINLFFMGFMGGFTGIL